jgi:hypothetical protein
MPELLDYSVEDLPQEGLQSIADAAHALLAAQSEVKHAEESLAVLKERVRRIEEEELPGAMAALGVASWTLTTGEKIEVKDIVAASITEANQPMAFAWLRKTGNDSLIKRVVSIVFGKGEDGAATAFTDSIKETLPENEFQDKAAVNANTLKAFVKERLTLERLAKESGAKIPDPLPKAIFGVYEAKRATIKKPK